MILVDMDFKEKLYIVKMDLFNNQLKEVVVGKKLRPKSLDHKKLLIWNLLMTLNLLL
jgi:hypothetical protein